ncbi:MAG: hypothetical protein ABH824_00460 [Nanoarchaeota archaeon]
MDKEELLKEITKGIYRGDIYSSEIVDAIKEAKDKIEKEQQDKCKHTFVFYNNPYGYDCCSKCGKRKF